MGGVIRRHFAFVLPNLAGGGAEKAVLKIVRALMGRGHDVVLLILEDVRRYRVPDDVPLQILTPPGHSISKGFLGRRLAAWRLARRIGQLSQERPFDLIVSTLPLADEICRLAHLPRHWCRVANTLSAEVAKLATANQRKAARRAARYRRLYDGHGLVAVSGGVAQDLRDGLGLRRASVATIPNPFDVDGIRAAATEPCAARPDEPYVVHVGRFAGQKRHDLLLDAWSRLPNTHRLVLLTDTDARLEAMIRARGLERRVTVAGFQTNPYPWIAGADLLVLCSDHEGLPNVLVEALACGTPVVSTDCPSGPREILADFPQCLVPCGDAAALAATMADVLANPPDIEQVDLTPYGPEAIAVAWEELAITGEGC